MRLHLILALASSVAADYQPTYRPTPSPTEQCKGRNKCLDGTNEGCGSDEFCNFDGGRRGTCESCSNFDDYESCGDDNLPNKGEKDCKACCFPDGSPDPDEDEDENDDQCEDLPGWTDSYGDGCDWYEDAETCDDYGSQPLMATDACCYCGGGSGGVYYAPTHRPTPRPTDWDGEIPKLKFKKNKGWCRSELNEFMGNIPCSKMKKDVLKQCWEMCAEAYGGAIVAVDGRFNDDEETCSCYCQDDCQCKSGDTYSLAVPKGYELPGKCD